MATRGMAGANAANLTPVRCVLAQTRAISRGLIRRTSSSSRGEDDEDQIHPPSTDRMPAGRLGADLRRRGPGLGTAGATSQDAGAAKPRFAPVAVDALSPTDVTIAGMRDDLPAGGRDSLIRHFDGVTWSYQRGSRMDQSSYDALDASSPVNAWAVGFGSDDAVAAHWNGSRWVDTRTDNPGDANWFNGVKAVSASQAWAVGGWSLSETRYALVEHFVNGHWKRILVPDDPGDYDSLEAVDADSPSDVWAVGGSNNQSSVEHWDGSRWTLTRIAGGGLSSVSAVSPHDVWALNGLMLAEHFNGRRWKHIPVSHPGSGSQLISVDAVSTDDVWAVGNHPVPGDGVNTLIEHWDGSTWSVVPSPNSIRAVNLLSSVSADSATDAWAVGSHGPDVTHADRSLILHWDGTRWTRVSAH